MNAGVTVIRSTFDSLSLRPTRRSRRWPSLKAVHPRIAVAAEATVQTPFSRQGFRIAGNSWLVESCNVLAPAGRPTEQARLRPRLRQQRVQSAVRLICLIF